MHKVNTAYQKQFLSSIRKGEVLSCYYYYYFFFDEKKNKNYVYFKEIKKNGDFDSGFFLQILWFLDLFGHFQIFLIDIIDMTNNFF